MDFVDVIDIFCEGGFKWVCEEYLVEYVKFYCGFIVFVMVDL